MLINFTEEVLKETWEEITPLNQLHYEELAFYKDIPLEPRRDRYAQIEDAGALCFFTVRGEDGALVGYAIYFMDYHIHYASCKMAIQDVLFLHPSIRGRKAGAIFIEWCDNQLKEKGVQLVVHHVKTKPELDFSPLLEKQGYTLVDKLYAKRLDKE